MKRRIALGLIALTASLGGAGVSAASAKAPPPLPIRGTITAVSGSTFAVTETSGARLSLVLSPGAKVIDIIPASLSEVKAGSYIGTAAVKQPSGVYRAMELQLFPASMRGVGLGTRAWNLAPHSSMTNGTVGGLTHEGGTVGTVDGSGDLTLTVNDGSGIKTVLVPSGVPVITYMPGSAAELQPGAHVLFFPAPGADGTLTTSRIVVGKNGLVPPM
jgi:hypothetical protein